MKAAILYGARDIRVEEVDKPKLETDEDILLRVKACGICGSDLHHYRHEEATETGRIIGHEFSGDIAEIGGKIEGFKVGDRVMAIAFGGNAEYVRIPQGYSRYAVRLPREISYEQAATIEPLGNSLHIANMANPDDSDTVVIMGAGAIGLGVIQILKMRCSARIIAVDLYDERLTLAKKLGANEVINARREDPYRKMLQLTGSTAVSFLADRPAANVDIVCDCAGRFADDEGTSPLQQAMLMLKVNGKVIEHSIFEKSPEIDYFLLARKQIKLLGSWGLVPEELALAVELIRSGQIDRKPIISHEFPLDRAKEAYETQLNYEEAVKIIIKP